MYQVYIVDDDELILDEIVKSIPWMDNGFEVAGYSSNPFAAIKQIPQLNPDVVFSDLKMPDMDGIEMVTELMKQGLECEFIMLSAFGTFKDSRSFFLMGGFDYILKPLQQTEIQIVLERLLNKLDQKNGHTSTVEPICANSAFLELIAYVKENFNQKHTLEQLGKRFSLNDNYICNLFAKHYNSTLTRFITELRMKEALRLMSQTDKSYKEIAIECGYPDYYYFCKVFKSNFGVSPTKYNIKKL